MNDRQEQSDQSTYVTVTEPNYRFEPWVSDALGILGLALIVERGPVVIRLELPMEMVEDFRDAFEDAVRFVEMRYE